MIDTAQAFGVDIGGSGIKAAPVDLNKGEFAEPRLKILTPSESTPQAIGSVLRKQLEHFEVPETVPVGILPCPRPDRKAQARAELDRQPRPVVGRRRHHRGAVRGVRPSGHGRQ